MKVVFMGSPEEVLGPLEALQKASHVELVAVVSQPPKEQGRGKNLQDTAVARFARVQNIRLLLPNKASDPLFLDELRDLAPDVIITAAYGQMLSDDFLSIPKRATINIHPSLLPKYRGATPVPAALLAGDQVTGVSILFTIKKMDAGAIITQKEFPILPHETSPELTARMFKESTTLLLESLDLLRDPKFAGTPQDEGQVVSCRKINKVDGTVDWNLDAKTLAHQFRAYAGWPGSVASIHGQRIVITDMKVSSHPMNLAPGVFMYDKGSKQLRVGTKLGCLEISKVKPAGKNEMDAAAFFNGCQAKGVSQFDHPTQL